MHFTDERGMSETENRKLLKIGIAGLLRIATFAPDARVSSAVPGPKPAKKQDDGQDEARLQDEIEPEVLCEVKRRGQALHISSHEIEKVDAVAHQADVGDDGLAEDCGGNPTSKGAEI